VHFSGSFEMIWLATRDGDAVGTATRIRGAPARIELAAWQKTSSHKLPKTRGVESEM